MRVCDLDDCENKHYARGFCKIHWDRYRRGGTTELRFPHGIPDVRLAERSERRGDCLVYTWGARQRSGHRLMRYCGKSMTVHRIAWILANGPIPGGMCVCHRCDVPDCINVKHLFLGTPADNNADRDRKGRQISHPGSRNGQAKLSEHQVIEIRALAKQGLTQRAIAAKYGVTQRVIWLILSGKGWTHVRETA